MWVSQPLICIRYCGPNQPAGIANQKQRHSQSNNSLSFCACRTIFQLPLNCFHFTLSTYHQTSFLPLPPLCARLLGHSPWHMGISLGNCWVLGPCPTHKPSTNFALPTLRMTFGSNPITGTASLRKETLGNWEVSWNSTTQTWLRKKSNLNQRPLARSTRTIHQDLLPALANVRSLPGRRGPGCQVLK